MNPCNLLEDRNDYSEDKKKEKKNILIFFIDLIRDS